ncbi:integrase core domain-containing protein [Tuwongella immobilis]|uniref:integrase core domain-containing protein n=1 Tax=Tuwongella immobilis TaxID=692036 RepID=UPI0036F26C18
MSADSASWRCSTLSRNNVCIERLWRNVKHEDISPRCYASVPELAEGLGRYFEFYNHRRIHQGLGYATPASVYHGG